MDTSNRICEGGAPRVLNLARAARELHTTTTALRKRLQRGAIEGYQRGGRWYAVLPAGRKNGRAAWVETSGDTGVISGQNTVAPASQERHVVLSEQARQRRWWHRFLWGPV